ncbi:MAG: hypothetical protein D9V44_05460 [Actinobacteria bacterium]|nr:MAG: hypothetical protein D9V44_05460 [Actinomycetota bacterium]
MRRLMVLAACILLVAMLAGCAPTSGAAVDAGAEPAGFWLGLWHGFTMLFTFVISLFNEKIGVYAVHNNGGWYDFGFLLGVMTFWGGGGSGAAGSRRR